MVETVWDAPESAMYQCSNCDTVFLYPIMSLAEEKAFFRGDLA